MRIWGPTVGCGILGAGSGFRVGWRAAGGFGRYFSGLFASTGEVFALVGGLGTGLSFYAV